MGRRNRSSRPTSRPGAMGVARVPSSDTASTSNERPLCRFFVMHNHCRFGSRGCAFSHTLPDGMSRQEAKKLVPCPFFARGSCKYGDHCQLRHDPDDVVTHQPPEPYCVPVESTKVTCGICLEDIGEMSSSSRGVKYGLLSCCNHSFCLTCLMEWRQQGSAEAQDRRTCPTCRKRSSYVVPSKVFPSTPEQKELIVEQYKARVAHIPCRNFKGVFGSCPFGRDCFYAHLAFDGVTDMKEHDATMEELSRERAEAFRYRQRSRQHRREMEEDEELEELVLEQLSRLLANYGGFPPTFWDLHDSSSFSGDEDF